MECTLNIKNNTTTTLNTVITLTKEEQMIKLFNENTIEKAINEGFSSLKHEKIRNWSYSKRTVREESTQKRQFCKHARRDAHLRNYSIKRHRSDDGSHIRPVIYYGDTCGIDSDTFIKDMRRQKRNFDMYHSMKVAGLDLKPKNIDTQRHYNLYNRGITGYGFFPESYKNGSEFIAHLGYAFQISRNDAWRMLVTYFFDHYMCSRGLNYQHPDILKHISNMMNHRVKRYSAPDSDKIHLLNYCILKHWKKLLCYIRCSHQPCFDTWKLLSNQRYTPFKVVAEAQVIFNFWDVFSFAAAVRSFSDLCNIVTKVEEWFNQYITAFFALIGFRSSSNKAFEVVFRTIAVGVATVMLFKAIGVISEMVWTLIRMIFEKLFDVSLNCVSYVYNATLQVASPVETLVSIFGMMMMCSCAVGLNLQQKIAISRFSGSLVDGFFSMMKPFINWCCKNLLGIDYFLGDGELPALTRFLEQAIEFTSRENIDQTIITSAKDAQECVQIWKEYITYRKMMLDDKLFDKSLRAEMARIGRKLEDLYLHALNNSEWIHARKTPVFIYMSGKVGQGKTTLIKALLSAVHAKLRANKEYMLKASKSFEHPLTSSHVYARTAGSEYWEGYAGQWAVTFNEIFCERDVSLKLVAASEILRAVESSTYSLNMAEASSKGKTFFTSEIVIATSNNLKFDDIGLETPSAFVRRIHFPINIEINEQINSKMDLNKGWKISTTDLTRYGDSAQIGLSKFCGKEMSFDELVDGVYKEMLHRASAAPLDTSFDNMDWDAYFAQKQMPPTQAVEAIAQMFNDLDDDYPVIIEKVRKKEKKYKDAQLQREKVEQMKKTKIKDGKSLIDAVKAETELNGLEFKYSLDYSSIPTAATPCNSEWEIQRQKDQFKGKDSMEIPKFNPHYDSDPGVDCLLPKEAWWNMFTKSSEPVEITTEWVESNTNYIAHYRMFRALGGQHISQFLNICHVSNAGIYKAAAQIGDIEWVVREHLAAYFDFEPWMIDLADSILKKDFEFLKNIRLDVDPSKSYDGERKILVTYYILLIETIMTAYWRKIHGDYNGQRQWLCRSQQTMEIVGTGFYFNKDQTPSSWKRGRIEIERRRFTSMGNPYDRGGLYQVKNHAGLSQVKSMSLDKIYLSSAPYINLHDFPPSEWPIIDKHPDMDFDNKETLHFSGHYGLPLSGYMSKRSPNLVMNIWDRIKAFSMKLDSFWGPILIKLYAGSCFAVFSLMIYNYVSDWLKNPPTNYEEQTDNEEERGYVELKEKSDLQSFYQKHNSGPKRYKYKVVEAEAQIHESQYIRFVNMMKNSRPVSLSNGEGLTVSTNAFFITPTEFFLPGHAFFCLDVKKMIISREDGQPGKVYSHTEFNWRKLDDDRDGVVITLKFATDGVCNIRKQLMESTMPHCSVPFRLMKLRRNNESEEIVTILSGGSVTTFVNESLMSSALVFGKDHKVTMKGYYLVKEGKGLAGFCGFPWISSDSAHQNAPIFGCHVARLGNDSIVCPLYQSDFVNDSIVKNATAQMFDTETYTYGPEGTAPYMKCKVTTHLGGTSRLRQTLLSKNLPSIDVSPVVMDPTLVDGVLQEPLKNAQAKYARFCHFPMPDVIAEGLKDPHDMFRKLYPTGYKYRKLTFEEAVFGDGGYIESIDVSTSSGFPHVQLRTKRKKRDFIDLDKKTFDPGLKRRVLEQVEDWEKGNLYEHVVVDHLKDELRSNEKKYVPRLFCGDTIEDMLVIKIILGDFLAYTKRHRHSGSSCIGYNPHNYDWTALGRRLFRFGRDRVVGGDVSSLDMSILRFFGLVLYTCLKYYIGFTDDSTIGKSMYSVCFSVVTTVHICGGVSYLCDFRNPSGNYITSFFNTIVTWTCLWACYQYSRPQTQEIDFQDGVEVGVYGDDNLGSVSPQVHHFNNKTIQKGFKDLFNMKYTDPAKGEDMDNFLEETAQVFLARRFIPTHGRYDAPLEKDSIFGMLHYVDPGIFGMEMQTMQNVDTAKRELTHYSEQERKRIENILDYAVQEAGYHNNSLSVEHWLARRLESFSEGFTVVGV